ncbi:MAG: hypothetical protein LC674_03250, partial [Actinobacteria bacterium]|nr:hypothetical protein [Actinomycetota bacterium]
MSGTIVSHRLRNLTAADRDRIEEITRAVQLFREDEILVALEVFDEAIGAGAGNTYSLLGAEADGRMAGWICWGPT